MQFVPMSQMAVHKNRLLIAGIAAVASLIAVNPMTPGSDLPNVQHRTVTLVAGEETWSEVVAAVEGNVHTIEGASSTAGTELSGAVSALTGDFGGSITDAIKGTVTNLELSLSGGWYGSDDGYVFGLFPGTIIGGPDGSATGSTLAEISNALQGGQYEQAFSYFDTWSLETVDHTLKALLNPFLDVTSHGATTLSIPVELSEIQTQLLTQFGSYTELKSLSDAVLSPFLGVAFGFSQDIETIATELGAGDSSDALSNVFNLPSDLTGDFLNGWDGGAGEPFTGLLSVGDTAGTASILQDLLVIWPEQLATTLTLPVTDITTDPITGIVTDVIGGL